MFAQTAALAIAVGGAMSPARPAPSYAWSAAQIDARQAQDDSVVVPGARSVFLGHGARTPRVFILLHGFTDAPTQFETLGERFFAAGDNVYIPRLPHHAERDGKVRALGRVTAQELAAFGDSCIDIAKGLGDSVIVVGLSAGGNVAASIVQHRADVLRAVLIAPAIGAGRMSDDESRTIAIAASRLPNITRSDAPDSTRPAFVQGLSTRGLAQVLELGARVRQDAERESGSARQIVFLLNENDRTVSADAAIDLARAWTIGAPLVSVYQFPTELRLPHNVMERADRGGNPELVLSVIQAIALGQRTPPGVRYQFIVSDWNRPRTPTGPP